MLHEYVTMFFMFILIATTGELGYNVMKRLTILCRYERVLL